MTLPRKQQKLLGFGARLQSADPTTRVAREEEVQHALGCLQDVYRQQQQLQSAQGKECAALFDPVKQRGWLRRRRGHVIESFGHRENGEWMLSPAEVLYLAERGTLEVFAPHPLTERSERSEDLDEGMASPTLPQPRALRIDELYEQIIGQSLRLEDYMVYAYMRRAGCRVEACEVASECPGRLKRRRNLNLNSNSSLSEPGPDQAEASESPHVHVTATGGESGDKGTQESALEELSESTALSQGWKVQRAPSPSGNSCSLPSLAVRVVEPQQQVLPLLQQLRGRGSGSSVLALADGTSGCCPTFLELQALLAPPLRDPSQPLESGRERAARAKRARLATQLLDPACSWSKRRSVSLLEPEPEEAEVAFPSTGLVAPGSSDFEVHQN